MPQAPLNAFIAKLGAAFAPATLGKQSDLLQSPRHLGKYTTAYQKGSFYACNQAGHTTSIGLATTYLGIVLSNPINSPVNLAVTLVTGQMIVDPGSLCGMGIAIGFNGTTNVTHTVAETVFPTQIGASYTGNGLVDRSATLPTAPTYARLLATAETTAGQGFVHEPQGGLILPPGGYLLTVTTVASGASGFIGSIEWEEVAP